MNLVGVLYEAGRQGFQSLHNMGAKAVAEAAAARGITRFVQMSALGADEASPSKYACTKAQGEAAVRAAVPQAVILRQRQGIDALSHRLNRAWNSAHDRRTAHLHRLDRLLHAIGPQQVLSRGYSITMLKKERSLVRSPSQLRPGDRLLTRFSDGQVESIVEDSNQPGLFE